MSQSGIKVEWVLRGASVPGGEDAGADDLELDFFFFLFWSSAAQKEHEQRAVNVSEGAEEESVCCRRGGKLTGVFLAAGRHSVWLREGEGKKRKKESPISWAFTPL